jgi:hypothetical protein
MIFPFKIIIPFYMSKVAPVPFNALLFVKLLNPSKYKLLYNVLITPIFPKIALLLKKLLF